jgi:hypothetical protein
MHITMISEENMSRKTGTRKITSDRLMSSLLLSLKAPAYLSGLYV